MTRSEDELRAFFRGELRPHVERWKRLPRWRPPTALESGSRGAGRRRLHRAAQGRSRSGCSGGWWWSASSATSRASSAPSSRRCCGACSSSRCPGVAYDPGARIPSGAAETSGLFPESWNHESGEDYVSGKLGATEFRFSELCLVRKSKDERHVVFHGLFFIADFHKSFRGRTYLLPDLAERALGDAGTCLPGAPALRRHRARRARGPGLREALRVPLDRRGRGPLPALAEHGPAHPGPRRAPRGRCASPSSTSRSTSRCRVGRPLRGALRERRPGRGRSCSPACASCSPWSASSRSSTSTPASGRRPERGNP